MPLYSKGNKPHVLFLFSDTGGGHRSAAEAIIEAFNLEFPNQVTTEMVDFFNEYAPPPLDLSGPTYPPMAQIPDIWELTFSISNGRKRGKLFQNFFWLQVRHQIKKLIKEHPCDIFISVHPIINPPMLRSLPANHPPYIISVTDMVTTHVYWYEKKADYIFVATEEAKARGIYCGVDPEKMEIVGLPVLDKFCYPVVDKTALREKYGFPLDMPVLLMVGGGEGMGILEETVIAIAESGIKIALAVVAGKNVALKERLEAYPFKHPAFIFGFTREMPELMQASDFIATKGGPGTISEAFIAGLPILIYDKMPGQEDGNVAYVVDHAAGVWAPSREEVLETLRSWVDDPALRKTFSENSRALGQPFSSRKIARKAMALLHQNSTPSTDR